MKASQGVAGRAAIAIVLAGIFGGVGCQEGTAAKASLASGDAWARSPSSPSRQVPVAAVAKPECEACAMEDMRLKAHKDQVVVSARYLGLKERWADEHRSNRRCTRDAEVMGVVRFALVGENPWHDEFSPTRRNVAQVITVDLPCPELSRPQYAKMYQYDPDDSERDGLGHAPVLQRGQLYLLTFVKNANVAMRDSSHLNDSHPRPTLVAVNPSRP